MLNRCVLSCGVWSTAGRSSRRLGLAVLVVALACAPFAASPPAAVAGPAPSTTVTDPADTSGVLDLLSVRVSQVQGDLRFTFTTRRPFQVSALSAQSRRTVCLEVGPRGVPARAVRLCLTGRLDAKALYRSPVNPGGPQAKFVPATVTRPSLNSATVEFAAASAGLGVGRYDWSVSSVWVRGSGCTRRRRAGTRCRTPAGCLPGSTSTASTAASPPAPPSGSRGLPASATWRSPSTTDRPPTRWPWSTRCTGWAASARSSRSAARCRPTRRCRGTCCGPATSWAITHGRTRC